MSDIYQSPQSELVDPSKGDGYGSVEMAINGYYEFNIGELLSESWARLKGMKTQFWLAIIILAVISSIISALFAMLVPAGVFSHGMGHAPFFGILQQIVMALVTAPITAGIFILALKHSIEIPVTFSEIFNHFSKAGKLLLLYIVMYIMVTLGFLLLILPGIYLIFAYIMAVPLLVERNLGVWQALEISRKAITKKWFKFFALWLVFTILMIVAAIPLGIGLIWVVPWFVLSYAILYRNMFGIEASTLES